MGGSLLVVCEKQNKHIAKITASHEVTLLTARNSVIVEQLKLSY